VTFRVTTTLAYPVASYTWDFNGDGSVDLTCNSLSSVTASYQQIGLYLATVTVTDTQGNRYTDTVIVNVMDAVAMGDFFTGKWNDMKNALYSGDISRALSHYAEESKDAYNQQFTALSPYLQQIVTDMGSFHLVRVIDGNAAECELRSVKNGITYSFQVLYVRDDNGNWGIHSF
jgi:PKD repeat protein